LFVVEKLMGGKNIIDELKFVKKKPKMEVAPVVPDVPAQPVVEPAKKETTRPTLQPARKK
jgi:hypothetical protein